MIDLGEKSNLRWGHRIVVWQEELELEDTAYEMLASPEMTLALGTSHLRMETVMVHESKRRSIASCLREELR